jgi:gluconate 2-dehydrogenase
MKGKILITDTLFISSKNEHQIADAGYGFERLDVPAATEAQLIEALKGKVGYILGGIEKVTDAVIDSTTELKAIIFTGADWLHFIPGHKRATEKGIAIANTPGANARAVAEYTLTLMLAMIRDIFELGRTGDKKFETTRSLNQLTVGIIGMGRIGSLVAAHLNALGVKEILYFSRKPKPEVEKATGAKFVTMDELLQQSDIVSLHASKEAGAGFIGKEQLAKMKDGALLINCGFAGSVDADALYAALSTGRIRSAQDDPIDERFKSLPLSVWFSSNAQTAFNTQEAIKLTSDMATISLLNLLETGDDQYKVN